MRVVDLSLGVRAGMPVYPGDPEVELVEVSTAEPAAGEYGVTAIRLGSHTGTHLDAPRHLFAQGAGVEAVPLAACLGPARVVDCSGLATIDLSALQARLPEPQPGERILLRTDWDRAFGTEAYYHDFPGLALDAVTWLAGRGIALLGLETPSVCRDDDHAAHAALLRAGVVIVEGLARLREIGAETCWFAALPLALEGLGGSPVRAVAWV